MNRETVAQGGQHCVHPGPLVQKPWGCPSPVLLLPSIPSSASPDLQTIDGTRCADLPPRGFRSLTTSVCMNPDALPRGSAPAVVTFRAQSREFQNVWVGKGGGSESTLSSFLTSLFTEKKSPRRRAK